LLTFSALKERCAYPSELKKISPPKYARDKAAGLGTEFHECVSNWIRGVFRRSTTPQVDEWFNRLFEVWVPPPGCRDEYALGIDADGVAYEVDEPEPHVYTHKTATLITAGRLDAQWIDGGTLNVVDWKTGQGYLGKPWDVPQIVAQAVCAAKLAKQNGLDITHVRAGAYYARLGIFDMETRGISEVDDMFERVKTWAMMDPSLPRPGGWCLGCWDKKECAAFAELTAA
jgi:hypothetical protein